MAAVFFGATARRPFFVLAAALCARRALLLGLLGPPLAVPWTIVCKVEGPSSIDHSLENKTGAFRVKVTETPDHPDKQADSDD
jgi:hypothetical protein